jgi:hypothetical protein
MIRLISILFVCLVCNISFGQTGPTVFHRGYPVKRANSTLRPDSNIINLTATTLKKETYFTLNGAVPLNDTNRIHHLLFSVLTPKGDIPTTKKVYFKDKDIYIDGGMFNALEGKNDSIYFTSRIISGTSRKNIIGTMDKSMSKINIRTFNGQALANAGANILTQSAVDTSFFHVNNYGATEDVVITRMDKKFENPASRKYSFNNKTNVRHAVNINALSSLKDTTYISTGSAKNTTSNSAAVIVSFNKQFIPSFAKTYRGDSITGATTTEGKYVYRINNEYIIAGTITSGVGAQQYRGVFVLRTRANGNIIWSKIFDRSVNGNSVLNGLAVAPDNGDIVISGSYPNNPFIIALKADGTQRWANLYSKSKPALNSNGYFINTEDKGYVYFYNETEATNAIPRKYNPSIIKTNAEGVSSCEIDTTKTFFVNHTFKTDTLLVASAVADGSYSKLLFDTKEVSPYEIPILSLKVKQFCPAEPIDWTFQTNVRDAISYKWSDKSTADTLRVFKKGEYSVTVTVGGKYCFMLCDTATLSVYEKPTAMAAIPGRYCEGGQVTIEAKAMAEANPVSYSWSTGAGNVSAIQVVNKGIYTVTVTDNCKETATAQVNVSDAVYFGPPTGSIAQPATVCKDAPFMLNASGNLGGGTYTYKWSTGETTSSIQKTALGTYTVTVTDMCNKSGSANLNVGSNIYFDVPSAAISGPVGKVCKDTNFTLNGAAAGGDGGPYTYKWNNNATTNIIQDKILGPYMLTVTDRCNQTGIATTTVSSNSYFDGPAVSLSQNNNNYCTTGKINIAAEATAPAGISSYKWSSGNSTSPVNQIDKIGKYSVTVTDVCGLTKDASIDVKDLGTGNSCIRFPKVFLPEGAQLINRTFGGINQCGADSANISDYVLKVYNRWGNEVFSATKLSERWDGQKEGSNTNQTEDNPVEVYVWYVKYNAGPFCQVDEKGDVTLLSGK